MVKLRHLNQAFQALNHYPKATMCRSMIFNSLILVDACLSRETIALLRFWEAAVHLKKV